MCSGRLEAHSRATRGLALGDPSPLRSLDIFVVQISHILLITTVGIRMSYNYHIQQFRIFLHVRTNMYTLSAGALVSPPNLVLLCHFLKIKTTQLVKQMYYFYVQSWPKFIFQLLFRLFLHVSLILWITQGFCKIQNIFSGKHTNLVWAVTALPTIFAHNCALF